MTEVSEIKNHFEELQNNVDECLPKVDSDLMCDLLTRQQENHTPMYMLDVFTKPDIDSRGELQDRIGSYNVWQSNPLCNKPKTDTRNAQTNI